MDARGKTPSGRKRSRATTEENEARRLAEAYWALWRRNWRPPFSLEDRPAPERAGSGRRGAEAAR